MSDTNNKENALIPANKLSMGQRIPGDVVNKATEELPDNQRSAIRRLHATYVEKYLTLEETGQLIDMSDASISTLFRGKYEGNLENVVRKILSYFRVEDERTSSRKLAFIETGLTRKIWRVCDGALEFQKIAYIIGDQQIGKTEALKAYRDAHNHGSTIYVRMPPGGALQNFVMELARVLRIPEGQSSTRLRDRVKSAFDSRMLLIVDEGHLCIKAAGRSQASVQGIDYIREIFDEKQCGVVICATKVFQEAMNEGASVPDSLRQSKRRRLCILNLPPVPPHRMI